jgi:xylan 1,4-beta-xylosidase
VTRGEAAAALYTNPVIPGSCSDPSICRVGDRYYLVTSSFEYFPGIPLFESEDLVSWRHVGHVLDRASQLDLTAAPASGGLFAPTIRHDEGTFYVTCTNVSAGGHFIVHSADPPTGWSDPVWVDQDGIDPSLYFEDGVAYLCSNVEPDPGEVHEAVPTFKRGIQMSIVNPLSGEILAPPRYVWSGTGGRFPEGPHIFKRNDYYYLVIAEGGTEYGHMATVARAREIWGPYDKSPHGPMIDHRSKASPFQAVGHADLVVTPDGDWWAVCLGIRPLTVWPYHVIGRETLLAPVSWTEDGWPLVGHAGVIAETERRPHGLPMTTLDIETGHDDFTEPRLRPQWVFVRQPLDESNLLGSHPGALTLRPQGTPLDGLSPSFVGRRQQHQRFGASVGVLLENPDEHFEAGLMVRMNETHYYAIGLRASKTGGEIVLRQRFAHINLETVLGTHDEGRARLSVHGDTSHYWFTVGRGNMQLTSSKLDVRMISTEIAGGFTGVLIGMYSTSLADSSGSARFEKFQYDGYASSVSA